MMWETTTLGEHCTITSSKRFHLSDRSDSGVPFYCSKEIIQKVKGEYVTDCDYIREESYDVVKRQFGVPEPGDLLITTRGTYGIPYVYKTTDRFYFADGNLTWLKGFDRRLNVKYLYYWILSHEGQKKIDAIAKGTAQKAVPIDTLKTIQICLPPIKTQQKIADILSAYDDLIETNRRQIKLLEEAAQRLYKEWFVDLRFPGWENAKIVDGVPEGWRVLTVSELGNIITGKTPSTEKKEYYGGGIPFVKIPDMHDKVYPIETSEYLSEEGANTQSGKYIPPNSIIVSCIGTVGLVNITITKCQTNQQINSIILHNKHDLYFVYFTMSKLKELLEVVGSNGATMTNVNKTKFGKLTIIHPSGSLVELFYDYCDPAFCKIRALSMEIVYLQESRDRLLPKLMTGAIEV